MTKTKKVVRTIVVAGVLCSLAAIATFSAFSSQADNPGNSVSAGTVTLTSNSPATAMYSMSGAKPGDSQTKCIKISYTGSLASTVKFYSPDAIGSLGQYVNVQIEKGSQTGSPVDGDCTGFTAAGGNLFNNTLNNLPNAGTAISATNPTGGANWATNDAVAYRVTATLANNNAAQGLNTGPHALRWEATNN